MTTAQIASIFLLQIVIIVMIINIYQALKSQHSAIQKMNKNIDLTKQQLAPLLLMPLSYEAANFNSNWKLATKKFYQATIFLDKLERAELESFESKRQSSENAFNPSSELKKALKMWSVERYRTNNWVEWKERFGELYIDLLSGKKTLKEVEELLEKTEMFDSIFLTDYYFSENPKKVPEIEEIYIERFEEWKGENWRKRLDSINAAEDTDLPPEEY